MSESGKTPLLVSALAALAVVSNPACENSRALQPTPIVTATASAHPDRTLSLPLLLRPLPLDSARILAYNQGVIVNLTGAIDLGVNMPNLRMVNTDPRFGLNLTAEDQVITYFFPQSFVNNESGREEAIRTMKQQLPMIVSIFSATQGIERGRMRFTAISVADALLNLVARNRLNYPPEDSLWERALGIELTHAYIGFTGLNITDVSDIPAAYPDISADVRRALVASFANPFAYPFVPELNSPAGYFRVLGLVQ